MTDYIFKLNWLVYKIMDHKIGAALRKYARGKLCDIGCGERPYENIIKPYVAEHIGLDHKNTLHDKPKIDLFGIVYNIPVGNGYFYTVLCTAVLEHLEEPDKAIKKVYKVFGVIK